MISFATELYQQLSARRDALMLAYKRNDFKHNDPAAYQQYQGELRNLNRRLRIIRQQMDINPML